MTFQSYFTHFEPSQSLSPGAHKTISEPGYIEDIFVICWSYCVKHGMEWIGMEWNMFLSSYCVKIWVFAGCIGHFFYFVMLRLN